MVSFADEWMFWVEGFAWDTSGSHNESHPIQDRDLRLTKIENSLILVLHKGIREYDRNDSLL